jgi:hypothetical protein
VQDANVEATEELSHRDKFGTYLLGRHGARCAGDPYGVEIADFGEVSRFRHL